MNGTRTYLQRAALAVGLVILTAIQARHEALAVDDRKTQSTDTDEVQLQQDERDQQQSEVDEQSRVPLGGARRAEEVSHRRITRLRKLQDAMRRKLELSRSQTEAIERLFREYLDDLKKDDGRRRPFGMKPKDAEKLKGMRARVVEARKSGDEDTARELREQLRQMMRARTSPADLTAPQFIKKLEAELDEDQRPAFQTLVKRLRIGALPSAGRGELRTLWRIVMRPDVDLADEQRRTIQGIIRKGLTEAGGTEQESNEGEDIAAQVRAKVFKELTTEQRITVEALLKESAGRSRKSRRPEVPRQPRPTKHADDEGAEQRADEP